MNTDPESENEFERNTESLERFENMLANDDQYYFDVDDLEELVEHYMVVFDLDKAWKVLELASQQHPHNKDFELKRADILALKGDDENALKSIALLESIDPTNVEMLIMKGVVIKAV